MSDTAAAIAGFLDTVERESGVDALSEAKRIRVRDRPEDAVVVTEDGEIAGVAVAVRHASVGRGAHWAVETVVRPDMRFPAFEGILVERALAGLPTGADVSVWSSRPSLSAALGTIGFTRTRRLLHMTVDLPVDAPSDRHEIGRFTWDDLDALIALNGRAFAAHREAASLDRAEFEGITREHWFDPDGILIARSDGDAAGFCWTKVHPGGDGEIYRIAVDPGHRRQGLGRDLVLAGFGILADHAEVTRGTLWVDEANASAVRLYEAIGMRVDRTNDEFERR